MIQASIQFNIRYAETDQMGFVYYGNYAQYFEIGRVEALKAIGISYRSLEESGLFLPVRSLEVEYLKAAKYDDLIEVRTLIPKMPSNRIDFEYEIYRAEELLVTGKTTMFFMDQSGKPIRPPKEFLEEMRPHFN